MTQTLLDFIAAREAEIKSLMAELRAESKQLKAAKAAATDALPEKPNSPNSSGKRTIKDMILGALDDFANGARAEQIVMKIEEKFGEKIARSSMSPQLTRLKNDGLVVREDNLWKNHEFVTKPVAGASNPAPAPVSNNVGADQQFRQPPMGEPSAPTAQMQPMVPPAPQLGAAVVQQPMGQGGQQLMPNRST